MTLPRTPRSRSRSAAAVAAVFALAVALTGCGPSSSEISVRDARVALPVTGDSAAVYLTIRNAGDLEDELVSVETSAAPMTHLHRTSIDDDGRASMGSVGALRVPAGSTVKLAPGTLHLMMMDPEEMSPGDEIPFTLTFRTAGKVEVTATATDDIDVVMGR